MSAIGLVIILGVFISYLAMLFAFHRFTYKTWIFDVAVGVGMVLGAASWIQAGGNWFSWSTIALGVIWFLYISRSTRVDDRPRAREILASLVLLP